MENNKEYIEKIFKEYNCEYSEIDLSDDGQYYALQLNVSDTIPDMGKMHGVLCFVLDYTLCVFVLGGIYRYKAEDEEKILSLTNEINKRLKVGKLVIQKEHKHLYYTESRDLKDIKSFDVETLDSIINASQIALAITYSEIKGGINEK